MLVNWPKATQKYNPLLKSGYFSPWPDFWHFPKFSRISLNGKPGRSKEMEVWVLAPALLPRFSCVTPDSPQLNFTGGNKGALMFLPSVGPRCHVLFMLGPSWRWGIIFMYSIIIKGPNFPALPFPISLCSGNVTFRSLFSVMVQLSHSTGDALWFLTGSVLTLPTPHTAHRSAGSQQMDIVLAVSTLFHPPTLHSYVGR